MYRALICCWLVIYGSVPSQSYAASQLPDPSTLRTWIHEMKIAPRGPFQRLRWFCNDGTILPPIPYACREHGGGVQHGEWNQRARQLRDGGYLIANVLADIDAATFTKRPDVTSAYAQILLERFLIAADDGWIFRRARFYRGALHAKDEARGARHLIEVLTQQPDWLTHHFLPLREGVRLLPHGQETTTVAAVRQLSAALHAKDAGFGPLRNKIHAKPELADAARVREYAQLVSDPVLARDAQQLATALEAVYAPQPLVPALQSLARHTTHTPPLAQLLRQDATALRTHHEPSKRFTTVSHLLAALRDHLPQIRQATHRLTALDLSLVLERELFRLATQLRPQLADADRRQRLQWLSESSAALYGIGFLSAREWQALREQLAELSGDAVSIRTYKASLDYLARVPGWSSQRLRLHFSQTMQHLATIEPHTLLFIQERLRGSPLLWFAALLDVLHQDANRLAGITHQLLGHEIGTGLRSLNPGLARGVLRLAPEGDAPFDAHGIYLLPETISSLPPVAGILTAGAGHPLSHVQLLARNLDIPNVSVDAALIPQLVAKAGTRVVLAVSPAGSVHLAADQGQWDDLFAPSEHTAPPLIHPDLEKLALQHRALVPTHTLRATDSGRIVGPKAANLGELMHHFPDTVPAGLAIPFGVFRSLLSHPMPGEGRDVFAWMVDQYAQLNPLTPGSAAHSQASETFRRRLQQWIATADPGEDFRQQLRTAMTQVFGADGTYGVFVRSDTNVEDLPGFTGADLHRTIQHVVGFEAVLRAISQAWASPFSQRAYAWRQAHMDQPQHVYPAVLLMQNVPVDTSGVMVTQDIETGVSGWLSVAVNEGVGGAVNGRAAESLRIHMASGKVRLLSQATAPTRRILRPQGGVAEEPVSYADRLLQSEEIAQLIQFAKDLPRRFPALRDTAGHPAPADVEFGFLEGQLYLFQLRPFLNGNQGKSSRFLQAMDRDQLTHATTPVSLHALPTGARP